MNTKESKNIPATVNTKESKNIPASVLAKLKNISEEMKVTFQFLLTRYSIERFLYRLSVSNYAERFILKGGNLLWVWQEGEIFRPTKDSDFLYSGNTEEEYLKKIFVELCGIEVAPWDGILFDPESISIGPIREETEYGGTRITLLAFINRVKIPMQFDIGVGDIVIPGPEKSEYPVLLGGNVPCLLIYTRYSMIAEKAETMVSRGMVNSRMKDIYDIWLLSELYTFSFDTLLKAIEQTFERRKVPFLTEIPLCFTDIFATDTGKHEQWNAFCRRNELKKQPDNFESAMSRVKNLLLPIFIRRPEKPSQWEPEQGWK